MIILVITVFSLIIIAIALLIFSILESKNKPVQNVSHKLERDKKNPIIAPTPTRHWEHGGTFNPAAVKDDTGAVHLLYRAVGADGISRIGHASSKDGHNFDNRTMYPVYEPLPGFGMPFEEYVSGPKTYCPEFYTSGGGWGGSEDPRVVEIDGRVYMTYVAFEGWQSVRIGLTSIKVDDLKRGRWNWKRPKLISPPGQTAKNWVLFPEKINGKFAIIHNIVPDIQVEYVDNLDMMSSYIKSPRLHGPQPGRKEYWDNWIRGAGPPPIKTEYGWLLLYHAMDQSDPNKYKVGAMLLDLSNPKQVLYRSPKPILEPDAHYENDSKPGVVYASGAVVIGGQLKVYYGGGDKHVCVAETPLKNLLDWMLKYGKV